MNKLTDGLSILAGKVTTFAIVTMLILIASILIKVVLKRTTDRRTAELMARIAAAIMLLAWAYIFTKFML